MKLHDKKDTKRKNTMTTEKFTSEIETLQKFFELYCKNNHQEQQLFKKNITYQEECFSYSFSLCKSCDELLSYSLERLQDCPHDPKPKCRICLNPCYEKPKYKAVSKVMRYSGIRFGLTKIKKIFSIY